MSLESVYQTSYKILQNSFQSKVHSVFCIIYSLLQTTIFTEAVSRTWSECNKDNFQPNSVHTMQMLDIHTIRSADVLRHGQTNDLLCSRQKK